MVGNFQYNTLYFPDGLFYESYFYYLQMEGTDAMSDDTAVPPISKLYLSNKNDDQNTVMRFLARQPTEDEDNVVIDLTEDENVVDLTEGDIEQLAEEPPTQFHDYEITAEELTEIILKETNFHAVCQRLGRNAACAEILEAVAEGMSREEGEPDVSNVVNTFNAGVADVTDLHVLYSQLRCQRLCGQIFAIDSSIDRDED